MIPPPTEKTKNYDAILARNWLKLLVNDQSLSYFSPAVFNGEPVAKPLPKYFEQGAQRWSNAVVGQFFGKQPNFSAFQRIANSLWGAQGKVKVSAIESNLFVIQLPNAESRDRVQESGPWHILHKPLIVRKWEPGIKSLELDLSKIPIWIHFRHVPLELFSK